MAFGSDYDERTYPVKVDELLEILRRNREDHLSIVEEAQANFRERVIARLDSMLAEARAGRVDRLEVGLSIPRNFVEHFDNAIGLLEMTQRAGTEEVEISASEYKRFVQNQWNWTKEFNTSNAAYSKKLGARRR